MEYTPAEGHGLAYDPFKSLTVPRPIGWLSTISPEGASNLAPYSQWQNLTWDPPMVMFAANQSPVHGGRKDTVINAEQTGWFVWNMATWKLREAVARSAKSTPPGFDEFELAGVTAEACAKAPGLRVEESPCHLECRYVQTLRIPAATHTATTDLVIGQVEHVHIADEFMTPDGKVDIKQIRPIARLGYYDYTTIDTIFEMATPGADEAELAGLEGTSLAGPRSSV